MHVYSKLALIALVFLAYAASFAQSTPQTLNTYSKNGQPLYIEGYIPHPQAPENGVRKVYLLIEKGIIKRRSFKPFTVSSTTRKITERAYGALLLSSGFIDLHGHLKYNVIPLWQEAHGQFGNRFDWRSNSSYKKNVTSYLNNDALGDNTDSKSLYCQTYHYAEIKSLLGGVTSVQGLGQDANCTAGLLARNVEIASDYDETTGIRVSSEMINPSSTNYLQSTIFPEIIINPKTIDSIYNEKIALASATATTIPSAFKSFMELRTNYLKYFSRIIPVGDIRGLIAHLSEGRPLDSYNRLEYKIARATGLAQKGLIIVHGVGLDDQDFKHASDNNISIVWSPFSNLLLYGQTLNLTQALAHGINISLGADWSPSGSKNLLDEVKIAKKYLALSQQSISDRKLYEMMTINPAKALKLENKIGQIAENYLADIVAFKLKSFRKNPFTQIIDSDPSDIQLVMVGGEINIAKERFFKNSKAAEYILSSDEIEKNHDCEPYKFTQFSNNSVNYSDLVSRLKNVFPVFDTATSCNDDYYKKSTNSISELMRNGQISTNNTEDERKFDSLQKQIEKITPTH